MVESYIPRAFALLVALKMATTVIQKTSFFLASSLLSSHARRLDAKIVTEGLKAT